MEGLGGFGSMLLLALLLLVPYCPLTQSQISSSERSGLLDLRFSLGLRSKDWPIKSDPCTRWRGIKCSNGRVTEINISGFRRTRAGRLNPRFSVDSLANFTLLESFNASYFSLPGSIPEWFGSRLGSLKVLDLRSSSVTGSIPSSLGNLTMLSELYLSGNEIDGSVPYTLGELVQLKVLDLSSNRLTGSVPSDLALLGNLSRFDLSSNFLSGSIPHGLGGISRLQVLNLSNNGLAGSIPVELGNLSGLVDLDLSKNSLSGSLPVGLSGLRNLQQMVIASTGLEGPLPDGLFTNLSELQVVVLSSNKFDGALPSALWSLPKLRVVDVSSNNFTGDLPSFSSNHSGSGAAFNLSNNAFHGTLTSFGNFSVVDVSGNYFQGKVPDGSPSNIMLDRNCLQGVPDQRTLDACRLFYAERGLTFDNFGSLAHDSNGSKRWIYILVGLSGGIGFVVMLVFVILLFIRKCDRTLAKPRGSANVGPVPEGDSTSTTKDPVRMSGLRDSFTYEQLFRVTGEFHETNVVKHGHSGDIFQGFLEGGSPVVVKRIHARSSRKDSFMMEIELLSKYSHTRLVPLLGHCLENEHEKFLVYKYMPNRDLASSLFRESNSADSDLQSLDWITRLKIATGAAEGLSYLHHECNPPLVHRDVQASSILLDDKFEVRLGSLSEIHAQEGDTHYNVFARFLRKQQSSEPGPSGSSSATCAYDVYCFGKVLLELVTGKLGISSSEDATTKEWMEQILAYIDMYDKELVTKIVDPSLVIDEDLLEEVWAMAIVARSCLNPKPSKRPPMKYVLKALENPLKVVREDSHSSGRLRTTSSRRSWSAAFFGSWRHSSSDNATVVGQLNRESLSSFKQPVRVGSHGSGGVDLTSYKRPSNEIFPEPLEMQDEDVDHS